MLYAYILTAALVKGPWSSTNLEPSTRAKKLLQAMTAEEKFRLLHGPPKKGECTHPLHGFCAYVGNVKGNDRLGIPPLNMNDGPQGFRQPGGPKFQGTSTAWPSGLTMAASWDVAALEEWGKGMGKEFRAKGANVQLGPGLCLARVVSASPSCQQQLSPYERKAACVRVCALLCHSRSPLRLD